MTVGLDRAMASYASADAKRFSERMTNEARSFDVVVVGAGAAGVGLGVMLRHLGIENFVILDRADVGASFLRWPRETRFITPSFNSNQFPASST